MNDDELRAELRHERLTRVRPMTLTPAERADEAGLYELSIDSSPQYRTTLHINAPEVSRLSALARRVAVPTVALAEALGDQTPRESAVAALAAYEGEVELWLESDDEDEREHEQHAYAMVPLADDLADALRALLAEGGQA
jgi:hypothetical protein